MPINKAKQHKRNRQNWATPWSVFETIEDAFKKTGYQFELDVAASFENTKCKQFFTLADNALKRDWVVLFNQLWWCNPPFDKVGEFLEKATEQFYKNDFNGIMLVPASMETKWFRKYITKSNRPRLVWPQRISFIDPDTHEPVDGNTIGSVLVAFMDPANMILPEIKGEPWIATLRQEWVKTLQDSLSLGHS